MFEVIGKYSTAIVMSNDFDEGAHTQIMELCNQPFTRKSKIRIMPDYHLGKGSCIGFTADLGSLVIPNLIGVDIGCSMFTVNLGKLDLSNSDFETIDSIIKQKVPSGKNTHTNSIANFEEINDLTIIDKLKNIDRINLSIGTLGGGNHFIELDKDNEGNIYLVIHTGSRNLGKQIAEIHQDIAVSNLIDFNINEERNRIISELKAAGKQNQIESTLKTINEELNIASTKVSKDLAYLDGVYRDNYLHDMAIAQRYSQLNRRTIADSILKNWLGKSYKNFDHFETMHNYIDLENNIIRKGAVSARSGETILIPINMRDGSLICEGKGNSEWNESAPHGAGRIYSRSKAKENISLEEFEESMQGIYTTCVGHSTIDESPMAYKSIDHILENISDTAEVKKIIKPIYNFKATS